ncbi:MAG: DNA ligase, partial [Nanoarchaeota archaeon]
MEFKQLAELFEKLDSTTKRGLKTAYIAEFLSRIDEPDEYERCLLLLKGRTTPEWDTTKLNVAAKTLIKALAQASGFSTQDIEDKWKDAGDLGLVAETIIAQKTQATLFSSPLTTEKVIATLRKVPTQQGGNSVRAKTSLISELITSADPIEAKYVTRITLEIMRIGAGVGILRDAIIWSTFP